MHTPCHVCFRFSQVCSPSRGLLHILAAGMLPSGLPPLQVQTDVQPEQEPELQPQTGSAQNNKLAAAILVGLINAVITVPVMTSFAAIIFQVCAWA